MNQVYVEEVPGGRPRTCRVCKKQFTVNGDKACVFHPESYSGETAQRWLPPGTVELPISETHFNERVRYIV
jgi:hypothetical protein